MSKKVEIIVIVKDKASKVFKWISNSTKKLASSVKKDMWKVAKSQTKTTKKMKANNKSLEGSFKNLKGVIAGALVVRQVMVFWKEMLNLWTKLDLIWKKADTVLWEFRGQVEKTAQTVARDMGMTNMQCVEATTNMADLLVPMWFFRKEAVAMSEKTVKLAGALSEWSNWKYTATQASEILAKAMLWETEQMKSMGIKIDQTSKAFNERIKALMIDKGLTLEQAKAMEIQNQIFSKSIDAQTAYANWAGSLARQQAKLSASVTELKERVATWLIPTFQSAVETISALAWVVERLTGKKDEDLTATSALTSEQQKLNTELENNFTKQKQIADQLNVLDEEYKNHTITTEEYRAKQNELYVSLQSTIDQEKALSETMVKEGEIAKSLWILRGERLAEEEKLNQAFASGKINMTQYGVAMDSLKSKMENSRIEAISLANAMRWFETIKSRVSSITSKFSWLSGARAKWWPVNAGGSYLVWEEGPEIFTPEWNGEITTSKKTSDFLSTFSWLWEEDRKASASRFGELWTHKQLWFAKSLWADFTGKGEEEIRSYLTEFKNKLTQTPITEETAEVSVAQVTNIPWQNEIKIDIHFWDVTIHKPEDNENLFKWLMDKLKDWLKRETQLYSMWID